MSIAPVAANLKAVAILKRRRKVSLPRKLGHGHEDKRMFSRETRYQGEEWKSMQTVQRD